MLQSIARALEVRDQTLGHGARVAALAEPVAVELGWDRERIRALRWAAPLHDVGKVKVRPQLLGKAGPLTLDEVAEIRSHPSAGAQLVLPLRRFHDALPYVLFHHERWDGEGYPARLRGRRIPIEARILAIADAFDAMISPRPYRRALTHEHALAEVEAGAGTQFDPVAANLFVDAWADGWDTWHAAAAS
jgi:HD-GYP domain-containing protein (c-di-GMP phosphodiesterase class II)